MIAIRHLTAAAFAGLTITLYAATPRAPRAGDWIAETTYWDSGEYLYDSAGNITVIGNDTYAYDAVNRLVSATAKTPGHPHNAQSFSYDRYGNISAVKTVAGQLTTDAFAVNALTNQLTSGICPPETTCHVGFYDGAGNRLGTVPGTAEHRWDAAGMMSAIDLPTRHEEYIYDANDERVAIRTAAGERFTVRGADQKVLREFYRPSNENWSWSRDYVYRNGTLVSEYLDDASPAPTRHYHADHLNTPRAITDRNGYRVSLHTYWPFGAEAPGSDTDDEPMKFTGDERDASPFAPAQSTDYMHARYYEPSIARFLAVDRGAPTPARPQSWNRYAYTENEPLARRDSNGNDWYAVLFQGQHLRSGVYTKVDHEAIVWIDPRGYGMTYEHPLGHDEYIGMYDGSWANTISTNANMRLHPTRFRNLGPNFSPAEAHAAFDLGKNDWYATGKYQCVTYVAILTGESVERSLLGFFMDLPPHPDLTDRDHDNRYVTGVMIDGQMWPADMAPGVGGYYIEVTPQPLRAPLGPSLPRDGSTNLYCVDGACF